jgi:putative ABC transport system permease protein
MLIDDVRHAFRRLRSRPGVMLSAAVMLGLGIGLTTAMFTVVDALILRPVPFRDPDRLANLAMMNNRGGRVAVAADVLQAWRDSPAFVAAEGTSPGTTIIETGLGPIVRPSARVSPGMFAMLGAQPVRGRAFDPSEGRSGTDDRVVLSEDVWRASFGADPGLVGQRITIDGESLILVGLMPSGFRFPEWNTVVWRPLDYRAPPAALVSELPRAYVRVAPGVPIGDALRIATDAARKVDGSIAADTSARPLPMGGLARDPYYQRAVPLLAGGVGLVFLVLCANVCSLLLARLSARQREFRMCAALGASRARLLRQAFVEHALLGGAGAAAGVFLAWGLVSLSRGFLPEAFLLRTLNPVDLDIRALVVAIAAGLVATMVAGVLPAWIGTRADAASSLGRAERTSTETRGARALTRALLVTELALACTLLVGATLLVRSVVNLSRADRGMRTEGVLTSWIGLPSKAYPDAPARRAIAATIEDSIRQLPGVERIAFSSGVPPGGGGIHFGDDWLPDGPNARPVSLVASSYNVGDDFFELYGIPLLRGRTFRPGDGPERVIVGERMAARLWPNQDPVGRSFRRGKEHLQVIGLVREINFPSLQAERDRAEFYRPFVPGGGNLYLNVSCQSRCPDEAVIRKQILAVVPGANIVRLGLLSEQYREELARPRAAAALAGTFAVIAVLAAAGGLFSVLSYAVGRRRREFGIRTALGASPRQIRGLVLRDGVRVAALGVGAGIAASAALARVIVSLQYGVTGFDPITWTLVLGLLVVTTLVASWRPARAAAHVDPVTLLRED